MFASSDTSSFFGSLLEVLTSCAAAGDSACLRDAAALAREQQSDGEFEELVARRRGTAPGAGDARPRRPGAP